MKAAASLPRSSELNNTIQQHQNYSWDGGGFAPDVNVPARRRPGTARAGGLTGSLMAVWPRGTELETSLCAGRKFGVDRGVLVGVASVPELSRESNLVPKAYALRFAGKVEPGVTLEPLMVSVRPGVRTLLKNCCRAGPTPLGLVIASADANSVFTVAPPCWSSTKAESTSDGTGNG
jgi:hypothetical protein